MDRSYAINRAHPWLILWSCFAAVSAVMVFNSLTQYLNQDEEQFITAAYLAAHMRLYADFLFLQTPIYPLVLSKLLILFSGGSPFLVGRLLSAALAISTVAVFFRLAVRFAESVQFAFILAALFASTPLMLLAYGGTRNDIMPIFFGLCGVWLILRGLNEDRKQPRCFSALVFFGGMCLALATGAKITAAFIPLGAMLYLFFRDRSKLVSFILGGAVGSLPIAYYTLIAFDKFLYGNIIFHVVERTRFYIDIGQAEILSLPYRVKSLLLTWLEEPSLVLATLFVSFVAFIGWRRGLPFQRIAGGLRHSDKLFIILLVPLAIPFVFLPSPFGAPYLQPAVPYVLLSSAALYPLAQGILEPQQMLTFVAMALVALALQTGRFLVQAAHHLNPSLWAVTQVHDLSLLIAHYVKGGTVATVYPALVLDAGTTVYSEFSTGIYFFRIGDHLASDRVLDLNGISPKTLPIVLAAKPPAAIFAGNTADDQPLLRWAWRNCYGEVDVSRWNGFYDEKWKPRLFLRPDQQGPCVNGGASAAH